MRSGVLSHHSGWEPPVAWSMLGLGRPRPAPSTTPAAADPGTGSSLWHLALTAAWGFPWEWPLGWGAGGHSRSERSSLGPYVAECSYPAWPPPPACTTCTRGPTRAWEEALFCFFFFPFLLLGLNPNTGRTFFCTLPCAFHLLPLRIPNAFLLMFHSKEDKAFSQEHLKTPGTLEF